MQPCDIVETSRIRLLFKCEIKSNEKVSSQGICSKEALAVIMSILAPINSTDVGVYVDFPGFT